MKKAISIFITIFLIISIFSGCSQKSDDVNADTSVTENTSQTTSTNTTVSATKAEEASSTTAAAATASATAKQTTARAATTAPTGTTVAQTRKNTTARPVTETTTQTTTAAPTTTTTTTAAHCTNNNNHSVSCGNMGRWLDSKAAVRTYVDSVMKEWADKKNSGEITREEYVKNCPSGYECWSCGYCGKWTGNFTY